MIILFFLIHCKQNGKTKKLFIPLALLGDNSPNKQGTVSTTSTNPLDTSIHPNPGEIYLANIKAKKYQIKPRGEVSTSVTAKMKSFDSSASSRANGNGNGNSNNNQNNGPQSEGDVDEVWINIKEIQFVSETGPKITVPTNVASVDLLKLKNDATSLFSKAIVPEGKYNQIRLILNNPEGKVVKNGVEFPLKVPSGTQSGLKLNGEIDLVSGLLLEFTLDFDLQSLKNTPGQGYILRPTIPISNIKTLLPFVHGMLIVKFKQTVNVTNNPNGTVTTGISSVDTILQNNNALLAKQFISDFPNMDMAVASDPEVGLDRVYLIYFKQSQDVLLAMFDLNNDVNVEKAMPNQFMDSTVPVFPNDNLAVNTNMTLGRQGLYLTAIKAYDGWGVTAPKSNVYIAVVDTGVDDTHEDLVGRVIQNRSFYKGVCHHFGIFPYEYVQNRENSRPQTNNHNHGTWVTGIVNANTGNTIGMAGIVGPNWTTRVLAINVFNDWLAADGGPRTDDILVSSGIIEATNKGVSVINMSLGGPGYEYCLQQIPCIQKVFTHPNELGAIRYANRKRVTLVASAGNEKKEVSNYPGTQSFNGNYPSSFPEVISVSGVRVNTDRTIGLYDGSVQTATDTDGTNYGKIDITAPAQYITYPGFRFVNNERVNDYFSWRGTSFSAPMVSAFAGLLLSMDSSKRPEQVLKLMCDNSTKVTINSDANINRKYTGCGMINLQASLEFLFAQLPTPNITSECDGPCSAGRWFQPFSYQFQAISGTPPYTWTSVGGLPSNSSLNSETGVLSGGATGWFGPGWHFDVIVTDSKGKQDRRSYYFESSL